MNNVLYRQYRYKFYLDARHSVSMGSYRGDIHPHTWEFLVELESVNPELMIPFNRIEELITEILSPYQNKYLNSMPVFEKTNPTTENIGEYFFEIILYRMREKGWKLLKLELSESPNRTYIVER